MYNLDISTAMAAAASNSSATPKTPEILNSLIAMTNPLDFMCGGDEGCGGVTGAGGRGASMAAKRCFYANNASSDSNSSSCSQEARPHHHRHHNHHHVQFAAAAFQPAPSVQQTCSQLIKAGLKLSIEQKRKLQSDPEDLLDLDKIKRIKRNESESEEDKHGNMLGLTPEDEERRRRRRERNKIAATKCRLKKREHTAKLITEAETLEVANVDYKSQLANLKAEKQRLEEVLHQHRTICTRVHHLHHHRQAHTSAPNGDAPYNRLPPVHSIETTNNHHSYSRPPPPTATATANDGTGYQDFDASPLYPTLQYKTPSIIVESINDDDYPSLTDLDHPDDTNYGYYSQNQNYGIDGCMA